MKVEQIYDIVNTLSSEYLGESSVVLEDLSNIVDEGSKIINLDNLDRYVRSLIDQIGKIVFVNRPYRGGHPNIMMDAWEYGAIMEKITYDTLPEATENESWELVDGTSYDPNIFTKPEVSAKFFSKKTTFEIPMSFAERQVKSAFQSAQQLNSFFSMIETAIFNSMTVKNDTLAQRTINSMIARVINSGSTVRAVNLLSEYNKQYSQSLTADAAIFDPDFIRYASYRIRLYASRMSHISTLFNNGGKDRFTPTDRMHIIMLSEFNEAAKTYLYSDSYHEDFIKLPDAEIVPYWQGSGTDYAFSSTSKIHATIRVRDSEGTASNVTVEQAGILAAIFDREACAITNYDRRVTANYNGRAEFFNNWYKMDAGYFNDENENFVVFYVADN